ncbi:hypothetical protein PHYPO_G00195000 [Pangasianodon hypophthalmus]|uniref:Secreted protein n=1 Tax=Pangasianodon hypophthalmus TaxID=310915 RepID=A0A5N5PIJ5_PANHP|nr:hypothetical protein PHYPO_G00195000 [Pangasianodon hypophthalmus]
MSRLVLSLTAHCMPPHLVLAVLLSLPPPSVITRCVLIQKKQLNLTPNAKAVSHWELNLTGRRVPIASLLFQ